MKSSWASPALGSMRHSLYDRWALITLAQFPLPPNLEPRRETGRVIVMARIRHGADDIEVVEVNFDVEDEPWMVLSLEDGVTIRLKTIVGKVLRATDRYTETGEPLYIVRSGNVLTTHNIPDDLMKPAENANADNAD